MNPHASRRVPRWAIGLLLAVPLVPASATVVASATTGADAASGVDPSPTIVAEPGEARPGDTVVVRLSGFAAGSVVISVCGNAALRGSTDCNQVGGEGRRLNDPSGTTVTDLAVAVPPVPCPCVLQAASTAFSEVATTPFTVLGHPVAPLERPSSAPALQVSVRAAAAPDGLVGHLRAALGGPTGYEVDVTVRNRSTQPVAHPSVVATVARRGGDDVAEVAAEGPEVLGPGAVWHTTLHRSLPAPAVGHYVWRVVATGSGPAATVEQDIRRVPTGLVVVVVVLVLDVVAVVVARQAKRRTRRAVAA